MSQLIKNGATTDRAQLDPGPTGTILFPGDAGWDAARTPWVVNVDQQPAAVALVRSVDDVSAVVTSAARSGLKVIARGTGHGALQVGSLSRAVLVRTTALNDVAVDPAERKAWAGSGAEWQAVAAAAAEHGLAVQAGSAADVGIAGFLLSGGISWLARSRGLAVNDVVRLEVVGADGTSRIVDQDHEPDVFWALRGGGGSFGVVTAFELRLHPQPTVSAGTLFFPMPRAGEVLDWRSCTWTRLDRLPAAATGCCSTTYRAGDRRAGRLRRSWIRIATPLGGVTPPRWCHCPATHPRRRGGPLRRRIRHVRRRRHPGRSHRCQGRCPRAGCRAGTRPMVGQHSLRELR
jgi:FAD/FMN-containing dehydrogenase